jgi:hypothetical protein
MVFALSRTQTVLWDQIRYSGDPRRFAWVLPIHPGAHIELSHDAFIAALDASTQTVITGPTRVCANGNTRSFGSGSGGGCGGSTASSLSADVDPNSPPSPGFSGSDHVTVVSQAVVGPYETVTVRSSDGEALDQWLVKNGFAVPPSIQPTIDAYAAEGFDFIALKLEPNVGTRAMQPVRVVTPGADPSLPLRMVAAGIGSHVGLTLYVISEGRYHPQNFPDVAVPLDQLTWDGTKGHSNYTDLAMGALEAGSGRGWLTEASQAPSLARGGSGIVNPALGASNPGLADAYYSLCATQPSQRVPCPVADAGPPRDAGPRVDASAPDAAPPFAGDAGPVGEGGAGAGEGGPGDSGGADAAPAADAGECFTFAPSCDSFDDLDVATKGMSVGDIRVTRLRAFLPADALAEGDLRLEATASQLSVTNIHHTDRFSDPTFDPCAGAGGPPNGSSSNDRGCLCGSAPSGALGAGRALLIAAAAFLSLAIARRRRSEGITGRREDRKDC